MRSVTPSPAPSRSASPSPVPAAAGPLLPTSPDDLAGFAPPDLGPEALPAAPAGGSGTRSASPAHPADPVDPATQGLMDPEAAAKLLAAALPSFWQAALANVQGNAGANLGHDAADVAPNAGPQGSEGKDAAAIETARARSAGMECSRGGAVTAGPGSDGEPKQAAGPGAGSKRQRGTREPPALLGRRRRGGSSRAARSDASSKVRRTEVLRPCAALACPE